MRKLDKTETLVTIGDMTYVREVTKLTCIVVCVYSGPNRLNFHGQSSKGVIDQ